LEESSCSHRNPPVTKGS